MTTANNNTNILRKKRGFGFVEFIELVGFIVLFGLVEFIEFIKYIEFVEFKAHRCMGVVIDSCILL